MGSSFKISSRFLHRLFHGNCFIRQKHSDKAFGLLDASRHMPFRKTGIKAKGRQMQYPKSTSLSLNIDNHPKTLLISGCALNKSKLDENLSVSWYSENQNSTSEDAKNANVPKVENDDIHFVGRDEEEEDGESKVMATVTCTSSL